MKGDDGGSPLMSTANSNRRDFRFVCGGVAALLVLCIALLFFANHIEGRLQRSSEQQVVAISAQTAAYVEERVNTIQDVVGAYTVESTDLDIIQPSLALLVDRFGFTSAAYIGMDGQGIDDQGHKFNLDDVALEDTALSQGKRSYSQGFFDRNGTYARLAQNPLYIDGVQVGALYVLIPMTLFVSDGPELENDYLGPAVLFDAATGEVLCAFGSAELATAGQPIRPIILEALGLDENGQGPEAAERIAEIRGALDEQRTELFQGTLGGEDCYICLAPVNRGSWYLCDVLPASVVQTESTTMAAMFATMFIVGALCVLLCVVLGILIVRRSVRNAEIESKQQLYRTLSECLDFAVAVYDPVNNEETPILTRAVTIFGVSLDELLTDWEVARATGLSDRGIDLLKRVRNGDIVSIEDGEFYFTDKETSTPRYVSYIVRPLLYEGKPQILVVMRDVTSERTIEMSMREAMEAAETANNAKSQFLSSMSHEIRTPMNVIQGKLQIARKHVDNPSFIANSLDDMEQASMHLLGIINELLDVSRIEGGKVNFNDYPYVLADLITSVADTIGADCKAKGLVFECQTSGPVEDPIIGDEMRMRQLLMNLLSNAVKYTQPGGHVLLGVEVGPSLAVGYESITFVVADDGIGMSPDFVEHLYEPFVVEGRSRSQGPGLGMPIVKSIVNSMGGDISVETQPGKGTTYTIVVNKRRAGALAEEGDIPEDAAVASPSTLTVSTADTTLTVDAPVAVTEALADAVAGAVADAVADVVVEVVNDAVTEAVADATSDLGVPEQSSERDGANVETEVVAVAEELDLQAKNLGSTAVADSEDVTEILGATGAVPEAEVVSTNPTLAAMMKQRRQMVADQHTSQAAEEAASATKATPRNLRELKGIRVLVVEDNEINAEIASELLTDAGLQVEWAEDGVVACEMFTRSPEGYYDVILMDVRMPRMNGYEATEAIRAMERADATLVPIVALSANAFAGDILESLKSGMNAHLSKPINLTEVLNTIAEELSKAKGC